MHDNDKMTVYKIIVARTDYNSDTVHIDVKPLLPPLPRLAARSVGRRVVHVDSPERVCGPPLGLDLGFYRVSKHVRQIATKRCSMSDVLVDPTLLMLKLDDCFRSHLVDDLVDLFFDELLGLVPIGDQTMLLGCPFWIRIFEDTGEKP